MIIVYGTRMFGRADVIDGLGHVTCRFVHIMFVPLVPIETIFLVDENRGLKLPFSFKAAMSGWLRGGAIMSGISALIGGVVSFAEGEVLGGAALLVLALLAFGSFPFWGFVFGRCSQQRRAELMSMFGLEHPAEAPAPQPAPGPWNQPQHVPQHAGPPPPAGGFGQPGAYGAPPAYGHAPQPHHAPQAYGPAPMQAQQPWGHHHAQGSPQQAPPPYGYGPPGFDPRRR